MRGPGELDRAFELQAKAIDLTEKAFRSMEQEELDMRRWVNDEDEVDVSLARRNYLVDKAKDAD
jgi:hypothetical protein